MDKRRNLILGAVIVVLATSIAALLFYMIPNRYNLNAEVTYDATAEAVANPSIGLAPMAENISACEENSMVFIELTWAEWEPSEGQYDIDFLEENFHLSRWDKEGKHAVLRFVCDLPGEGKHMDIPEWLYKQTSDGTFYSNESGAGYSPNYENTLFIEKHTAAIKALADYFNKSYFLSFVELGSIGHWGEWHVKDTEGNSLMPSAETCWEYVAAYTDTFSNAKIMMRRSYIYASEGNLGLYNDMLGDEEQTDTFFDWIENGGSQDNSLEIVPMQSFWNSAPSGGEITSSADPEYLYTEGLPDLIDQIDESHLSFIGPNIPDEETYSNAHDALLRHIGYKFFVQKLKTTFDFSQSAIRVSLTWENTGSAPAYWDYPVTLCVYNENGEMVYWDNVEISFTELSPDGEIFTENLIPYDSVKNGFSIGLKITTLDGNENITLANEDTEWNGDVQMIYQYVR